MKAIYIAGGKGGNTAVNIVKKHLEGLGHRVTRDAKDPQGWDCTMRWGISYHGDRLAINAHVNEFDKFDCFEEFRKIGVPCPTTWSVDQVERGLMQGCKNFMLYEGFNHKFPWLARKRHHTKGKDIMICHGYKEIMKVFNRHQHDFFTPWIPTQTEYRVWVFLGNAFAVYEKEFKGEREFEGYNRNRRMGFKFVKHDELRNKRKLTKPACEAVRALNMEFGAVDVLLGKDDKYYVLEVNSMPHIDNQKRSSGIRLAAHISKWAEGKYEHAD